MTMYNSLPSTTSLTSTKLINNTKKVIIFFSITLVAFFCIILVYITDIRIEDVLSIHKRAFSSGISSPSSSSSSSNNTNFGACNNNNNSTNNDMTAQSDDELRILIGVITLANQYQSRDLLRRVYHVQPRPAGVRVDVKFVFCKLSNEEEKILIPFEILTHNDIIILNCTENMNNGKTYTYFSSLPEIFTNNNTTLNPPYHYVMKTDYDTFVHVENLVESLKPLPRDDLYYGFLMPCDNMAMRGNYMAGFGYVMSWDIVKWISESEIPKNHFKGHEDLVTGEWLKKGNKGNNSFNMKWKMYDFPSYPARFNICGQHPLWPGTIAVHKLKTPNKWIRTLSFFNLTKNLIKPSKLYSL